jgi:DNA-directed RNA polymerase subunit RPC12/RpoP
MQGPNTKTDWLSPPAKDDGQAVYICAECGAETKIKQRDRLKCESCHCNILYKKRTKRVLCFEAR